MLQLYIFPDRSDYSTFCRIVNVFAHKGYLKSCQRPRPRTSTHPVSLRSLPAPLLSLRTSDRCHWCGNPFSPRRRRGTPFYLLPPAGYFCLQRQKYPKTPLETTFQDFLSALRPAANLLHASRAIGFPVCRCPSKGLCHHSFPLPLPRATVAAFPSTAIARKTIHYAPPPSGGASRTSPRRNPKEAKKEPAPAGSFFASFHFTTT